MKFKIDENLPSSIKQIFLENNLDAQTVFDENINGCDDDSLINKCREEGRILVTLDLDFSDIRKYQPCENNGIVIIRLSKQNKAEIESVVRKCVNFFKTEETNKRIWIVEKDKIRIRGSEDLQKLP